MSDDVKIVEGIINLTKNVDRFNVGDVVEWLDQGPAILLSKCEILDPISMKEYALYAEDPGSWPREIGWVIRLLETGEKFEVHEETLAFVN